MEITDLLSRYSGIFLTFIGGIVVAQFLPTYAKKKAENLATKEDIEVITAKIESVRAEYQSHLDKQRIRLQTEAATIQAFKSKALDAIEEIDDLMVKITLYCWKQLADRTPNEHYVWDNVHNPADEQEAGFHYYQVAIDKAILIHGLYLTPGAKESLSKLSGSFGMLSSMELALSHSDPDPAIVESAENGYQTGIDSVEKCRSDLMREFGLIG